MNVVVIHVVCIQQQTSSLGSVFAAHTATHNHPVVVQMLQAYFTEAIRTCRSSKILRLLRQGHIQPGVTQMVIIFYTSPKGKEKTICSSLKLYQLTGWVPCLSIAAAVATIIPLLPTRLVFTIWYYMCSRV